MQFSNIFKWFLVSMVVFMLFACGGGSGGTGDSKAPEITLVGEDTVEAKQNLVYMEKGATAIDDIDGEVAVIMEDDIDITQLGRYTVTYTAIDKAGNEAKKYRHVDVVEQSDVPTASYAVSSKLFASSTANYKLVSLSDEAPIDGNGNVDISLLEISGKQLCFIDGGNLNYPIPVELEKTDSKQIQLTADNVIKGMLRLSLIKEGVDAKVVKEMIDSSRQYDSYSEIINIIDNSVGNLNNIFSNEVLYLIDKLKINIITDFENKSTIASDNNKSMRLMYKNIGKDDKWYVHTPYIIDNNGNNETFINPASTYYYVYVDFSRKFTLWADEISIFENTPKKKFSIKNGNHTVSFEKSHGHNAIRMGCYVISTLTSVGCPIDSEGIALIGSYDGAHNSLREILTLLKGVHSISNKDVITQILNMKTGRNNSETILNLIVKDMLPQFDQRNGYFRKFKKAFQSFKLLNVGDMGYLVKDWIFAPSPVEYNFISENGKLTDIGDEIITAPSIDFRMGHNSANAYIDDPIIFTPTAKDNRYSNDELSFEWDFDGDGNIDRKTVGIQEVTYRYNTEGVYHPSLRVKNPLNKVSNVSYSVKIYKHNIHAVQSIQLNTIDKTFITTKANTHKLTLDASGFNSQCDVWARSISSGKLKGGKNTTCNESAGIITTDMPFLTSKSDTYKVWITDKKGEAYSNKIEVEVKYENGGGGDNALAPSISTISPSPITASSSKQYITINGNNFTSNSRVKWGTSNGSGSTVTSSGTTYINSSQIKIYITIPNATSIWSFKVRNNDGKESAWKDVSVINEGGGGNNPQNLTLNTPVSSCGNSTPEISLSWNGIDNVSAYKIHSNRVFSSGTYFKDVPSGQTSMILSDGLQSNYSYRLYVRAELSSGQIKNSNEVTVNTGNCDNSAGGGDAPDKPGSLTPGSRNEPYPELSNTNITLGWDSVSDATYYKVTLFDLNTANKILDGARTASNSYDASSNLRIGHNYFWEVGACNDNGCSNNRRVYFNIKGEVVAPDKPTGLNPGNGAGSDPEMVDSTTVTLSWDSANGATYYKVHVTKGSVGHSGAIVVRGARADDTSYSVSNLERGEKYWWYVEACNDDECTESDFYGFEVEAPPVGTPANLSVSINNTRVGVAWTEVDNATKYRVRLYDENGNDNRSEYVTDTYTSFSGLSRGHRYKIKVRAYVGSNYGSYTSYKYFDIEEENATPCPLRHFPNNRITEYLQKGYADGYDGKTQIEGLQKFLNEVGYNAGTADGIFGEQTKQAVIAYQNDHGLTADGKVGSNTRNAINNTSCN